MAALRASFRARLLEATDARRTETALGWFSDFVADTERVPFVDSDDEGGVEYNLSLIHISEPTRRTPI
eukprot:4055938-Pleurochrysis_carterae.AAC.2